MTHLDHTAQAAYRPHVDVSSPRAAGDLVELWVPARPTLIPTVRAVTADLATRAGFHFDAVDDLRMAVDEASAAAVTIADEHSPLYCRFVIGSEEIAVTVSTPTERDDPILHTTGSGWRILRALVDEVQLCADGPVAPTEHGPSTAWTGIRMIKRSAT